MGGGVRVLIGDALAGSGCVAPVHVLYLLYCITPTVPVQQVEDHGPAHPVAHGLFIGVLDLHQGGKIAPLKASKEGGQEGGLVCVAEGNPFSGGGVGIG